MRMLAEPERDFGPAVATAVTAARALVLPDPGRGSARDSPGCRGRAPALASDHDRSTTFRRLRAAAARAAPAAAQAATKTVSVGPPSRRRKALPPGAVGNAFYPRRAR